MSKLHRSSSPRIVLTEHTESAPVQLTAEQRDALSAIHPGMQVTAVGQGRRRYVLKPDQHVGVVSLPGVVVEIQPKMPMPSAFHLISHAADSVKWQRSAPDFHDDVDFTDLVALMFAKLVEEATQQGLLHGYKSEAEVALAPKGRIPFDELVRKRFGRTPPIDIEHDLFTADILENRLLLAALHALRSQPTLSLATRHKLSAAARALGSVTLVHFSAHDLPVDIVITPLNRHYAPALTLAQLVLQATFVRLAAGAARGAAFLVDMNTVFEKFIRNALRRTLGVDQRSFPDRAPRAHLDLGATVRLVPDLNFVRGGRVVWVGDAKYKSLNGGKAANADLYQLLAYCVSLGLPEGLLIYGTHAAPRRHVYVANAVNIELHVQELNVNASTAEIEKQVRAIAKRIEAAIGIKSH